MHLLLHLLSGKAPRRVRLDRPPVFRPVFLTGRLGRGRFLGVGRCQARGPRPPSCRPSPGPPGRLTARTIGMLNPSGPAA